MEWRDSGNGGGKFSLLCFQSKLKYKKSLPDMAEEVVEEARVYFQEGPSFSASVQDKFQERLSILFSPSFPAQISRNAEKHSASKNPQNVPLLMLCVFNRVGERVRLRHELHSQCGYQRAPGGCGRSQTGGD